jgi:outer membrane PBP1 activator LpoA protein
MSAKRCAVVVAAIALAGCGGGGSDGQLSKSEYEHTMQSEAARLTSALQSTNATSSKDIQEFASRLGAVKDDIAQAGDHIDELEPPPDAAADTQTIADVLHRIVGAIERIQASAAKNDGDGFQQGVRQLAAELRAAQPAVRDLKRKGYDVGAFGS